ncbi:MAG: Nif3-like dinuclear metal center hexameric protein [Armatimonadota bacterium]
MTVAEAVTLIESLAPPAMALPGDPGGLHTGDPGAPVTRIAVCLDATGRTLQEARRAGAQMMVAHHPLIYHPQASLAESDPHARLICDFVRSGIALYCAHTAWDVAPGGLNDELAQLTGIRETSPLQVTYTSNLLKLAVYVPEEALDAVRMAIGDAGAGQLGNYSHCSFRSPGTGSFRPLEGATPHIGEVGQLEDVAEWKLEAVVDESRLTAVLEAMRRAHPYEEIAYDLYQMRVPGMQAGIGRIGALEKAVPLCELEDRIAEALGEGTLRTWGEPGRMVSRVAVCGGSGGDLVRDTAAQGADLYITSEIRHHQILEARALGLALIDATHAATETPGMRRLARRLQESAGGALEVIFLE